jgi:hypothetical protein
MGDPDPTSFIVYPDSAAIPPEGSPKSIDASSLRKSFCAVWNSFNRIHCRESTQVRWNSGVQQMLGTSRRRF